MKLLSLAPILLIASSLSVGAEELAQAEYEERFNQAADAVERKYPETMDSESAFSIILEYKIRKAQAAKDPEVKDPYYVMRFADDLAKEMADLGIARNSPEASPASEETTEAQPEPSVPVSPAPAKAPSKPLTPAEEVQAYLKKVQAGQAGVDPKVQTRARSGDPYAQAQVAFKLATNAIAAKVAEGEISEAQAVVERDAAQAAYTSRVQQIQSAEQHEELMDELRRKRR